MNSYLPFYAGNFLFKHCWWLYKPLYLLYKKLSEQRELLIFQKIIRPGATVIDIGANIGFYTGIFSDLCGIKGTVHAFEPDPLNFKQLQMRLANKTNVQLNQTAVSHQCGTLTLYQSSVLNVDHRTYPVNNRNKKIIVPCIPLDSYLDGKLVDVIKMDIQGYEYQALQGMQQTLKSAKSLFILMELWPFGLQLAKSSTGQIERLLNDSGFSLYLLTKQGLQLFSQNLVICNKYRYYSLIACKGTVPKILS